MRRLITASCLHIARSGSSSAAHPCSHDNCSCFFQPALCCSWARSAMIQTTRPSLVQAIGSSSTYSCKISYSPRLWSCPVGRSSRVVCAQSGLRLAVLPTSKFCQCKRKSWQVGARQTCFAASPIIPLPCCTLASGCQQHRHRRPMTALIATSLQ